MSHLYILFSSFTPNSATSSRYLGYLQGLDEMGVDAEVYFFWPDKRERITEKFQHVQIHYLWEHLYFNQKYLKHLSYLLYVLYIFLKIKKGDKVYTYGLAELLPILMKKKGIDFYHERTEMPASDSSLGGKVLKVSLNDYYKYCAQLKGLIVISTYLKQHFVEHGVDEKKISIINIIVDPKRFEGLIKNQEVEPYIAYCGTVENAVDGVGQLIKAFAIVSRKHPEVKLYIAGRAPYEKDVIENEQLIKEYGLQDKVAFKGVVRANEVPQFLVNAKAVALDRPDSIIAKAGFPTKLGEYLLSKTPTVITRIGDIPLFLNDRKDSFLAEESNPVDFARQLNWILENPEEAASIGERGAELAVEHFSYKSESKKLYEVFFND